MSGVVMASIIVLLERVSPFLRAVRTRASLLVLSVTKQQLSHA